MPSQRSGGTDSHRPVVEAGWAATRVATAASTTASISPPVQVNPEACPTAKTITTSPASATAAARSSRTRLRVSIRVVRLPGGASRPRAEPSSSPSAWVSVPK